MKIWCISDTHERHNELKVPSDIDLVIFAGDEANSSDPHINANKSLEFFEWYSKLYIPYKVFVPGNHSTAVEAGLVTNDMFPNVNFLIHKELIIGDYKLFGSPYTPSFGSSWGYMKSRNRLSQVWADIPKDTDILITHGPPKGILDLTTDIEDRSKIAQVGCRALYNKVISVQPSMHIFGHIHTEKNFNNGGVFYHNNTTFVNASCVNNHSTQINNGFLMEA